MSEAGQSLPIERRPAGVSFWIHVTPRARHAKVGPVHGDALRVAVAAPPVEGRANADCARVLAEALGVPRAAVAIDPAARGRRKYVRVQGDTAELASRLARLASAESLR